MKPVTPEMKGTRDECLRIAQRAYPQQSHDYFMAEPDMY
jgi:hypothetical protein